jgi:transposase InsO family protein
MTFRRINEHLARDFPVHPCCAALGVSTSGYYAWLKDPVGKRGTRRQELARQITAIHEKSRRVYGSPRIHKALVSMGVKADRKTVAKIMRDRRIRSRVARRRRVSTTDSDHAFTPAPNVLDRRFAAGELNSVWLCDITYIPTAEGFVYLAGVMDLCSRRIVGWSMAEHLRVELVRDALAMATTRRNPPPGLIHHSDRGVQYCCGAYREQLKAWGMIPSMSRTGDCYDNAPAESFWATLKNELMGGRAFATRAQARAAIFEYIEVFYNRERIHSSLGYVSPEAFEAGRK